MDALPRFNVDVKNAIISSSTMSQLGADDWVLSLYPPSYRGYFVDAGSGDGIHISNTFKLDRLGWKGLCIDAIPRNNDDRANSKIIETLLYSATGVPMDFCIACDNDFSGIISCLGTHKNHVMQTKQEIRTMTTTTLHDVLVQNDAPEFIAYLNLDIEGAEYDVLKVFPFDKYKFGAITFEHNYEMDKKQQIHELLVANGYEHVRDVQWDAWYVSLKHIADMI